MKKARGFTLLELLLALALLGLLGLTLTSALNTSLKTFATLRAESAVARRAETAMRLLTDDLNAACLEPGLPFQTGEEHPGGLCPGGETLLFAATRHLELQANETLRGPALIAYRLVPEKGRSGSFQLERADLPLFLAAANDETALEAGFLPVAGGLRAAAFAPLSKSGGAWHGLAYAGAGADAGQLMPAALRINLEFWLDEENTESRGYCTTALIPAGLFYERRGRVQ